MFERFTDDARRIMVLANEEARMLNQIEIGPEHITLGLLRVTAPDVPMDSLRSVLPKGEQRTEGGHIPFSDRSKQVFQYSLREAVNLGCNYIGPEHLMLALGRVDHEEPILA